MCQKDHSVQMDKHEETVRNDYRRSIPCSEISNAKTSQPFQQLGAIIVETLKICALGEDSVNFRLTDFVSKALREHRLAHSFAH